MFLSYFKVKVKAGETKVVQALLCTHISMEGEGCSCLMVSWENVSRTANRTSASLSVRVLSRESMV